MTPGWAADAGLLLLAGATLAAAARASVQGPWRRRPVPDRSAPGAPPLRRTDDTVRAGTRFGPSASAPIAGSPARDMGASSARLVRRAPGLVAVSRSANAAAMPRLPVRRAARAHLWRTALRGRSERQRREAALPQVADLLAVSLHAGLNVRLALRRTAAHAPASLAAHLDLLNREIDLGATLDEALGAFAARTGLPDAGMLASILTGAAHLGSPAGDALERWADDLWTRRRHAVEAAARTAPVRILFPLVLLILPGLLLTTVVPLLASTLRTLGW